MSDAQRTIELIFKGVDQVSAVSDAVIRSTRDFAGGVESATQPLADLAVGAVQAEAAILAIGAAFTGAAVYAAADFQSAALDLQRVLSDTEPLEVYESIALDISSAYGESATSVLQSMADFRQAGFTAEEAATLTRNALDLVIAGDIEASEASDRLVASLRGFGAEASEASVIIDLLNGVSNQYATNLQELGVGFSDLAPVASAANFSMQETAAILTPVIERYRSGSEAANAFKTVLLSLVSDNARVTGALEELGVAQTEANGELRSSRDIYFDVAEAFQNLDENQQLYIAGQIAGTNQAGRFLAAMQGFDSTLEIAADGFEYLGSAAAEVETRLSSAASAADRTQTAFVNMLIVTGRPLLDEFTGVADAIVGIFAALGASAQDENGLGQLVDYIESRMGDLQQIVEQIAQNLPAALQQADFSGYADGIDAVVNAFSNLFDGIDLTTVDGLATAITRAGSAFEGLSLFVGGVVESFRPMFQYFVDLSENLDTTNPAIFEAAGNLAGFATQANILAGGLNDVLPLVEGLLAILTVRQGVGLIGALSGASTNVAGFARALGAAGLVGAAGAAGYAIGTTLVDPIDDFISSVTGTETTLGGFIYDLTHTGEAADLTSGSLNTMAVSADNLRAVTETINLDNLLIPEELHTRDASAIAQITRGYEAMRDAAGDAYDPNINLTEALLGTAGAAAAAADPFAELDAATTAIVPIIDEATGAIVGYQQGMYATGTASDIAARSVRDALAPINLMTDYAAGAAGAVENLADAQQRLSDDVAIALIESSTEERIANIEATTERVRAAYESVNVTIGDTGDTIRTVLGLLADSDTGLRERFDLERQLGLENEYRAEALGLQSELTRAQIQQLEAQTAALSRGDGIITIDGSGLEPELEAFMWRILQSIQVRVNEDGLGMLLGVGA